MTRELRITGIECENVNEAFGWVDACGHGNVIRIADRLFVVDEAEAERIDALRVPFNYLFDRDGQTVSIPNHL